MEFRNEKKMKQAYIITLKGLLYHVYSIVKNLNPYRVRIPTTKESEGNSFHYGMKNKLSAGGGIGNHLGNLTVNPRS